MRKLAATFGLALMSLCSAASASPLIFPVSVVGAGSYSNSANNIIDGVLTQRGDSTFDNATFKTTYWSGNGTSFIINLGGVYIVDNLTAYVDNNDDYLIEFSPDGVKYTGSFLFLSSDGLQPVIPGGQEILTTDPTFPASLDATTATYIGRPFAPVLASHLRVSAPVGDDSFGIGEVQVYGNSIPLPSSASLLMAAVWLLLAGRTYERTRASSVRCFGPWG